MSNKKYSIGEISEKMDIPISTIRYYDKHGLLPFVERSKGNIRQFSDTDIIWLQTIECLKNTGMELKDIKQYSEWCMEGDSTIDMRYTLFLERKKKVELQMIALNKTMDLINFKCSYYQKAKEAGTTSFSQDLDSPSLL